MDGIDRLFGPSEATTRTLGLGEISRKAVGLQETLQFLLALQLLQLPLRRGCGR
eukprot:CAMPEP_0181491492 /NCGR_PEP_ID=MMETSP1110-20121109/50159_1 /TAXON_ID=174948 /ORGANISM="Symbiodinium sp., Strain CCMP421" /LENGTH=53 /DNA_ID=CAMNT_0023618625 /DNA_START=237 /DNA_END=395 /DNA_ORIENTATION=-